MHRNQRKISVAKIVVIMLVLINAIVLQQAWIYHPKWYDLLYITIPLLLISIPASRKNLIKK